MGTQNRKDRSGREESVAGQGTARVGTGNEGKGGEWWR